MDRVEALQRLRACEAVLRSRGVETLSLFGSTARGEQRPNSDVDVAARISDSARSSMSAFQFLDIAALIEGELGVRVDLVSEPARKARLQAEIDRDRVRVF